MAVRHMIYLCRVHFKELLRTPIFYAYLCLAFVYYHYLNAPMVRLQQELGVQVNAWGYTAGVFSHYLPTMVFGLGAVMLFSDLPLLRDNALFESTRCSRSAWVGGRVLYVACVSVLYTFFMVLMCLVTCRGSLSDPTSWGKIMNTFANGYTIGSYAIPVELSLTVTGALSPLEGVGLVFLMGSMSAMLIGLCILALSLCLNRIAALIVVSFVAIFDFLITLKLPFWFYRLSPLSFMRLSIISNANMPYYPTVSEAAVTLLLGNAMLALLAFLLSHWHQHFANRILQEQY